MASTPSETEKTRVLLVEDHTIVRQGIRRLLETDGAIVVVGEAGDGRSAVETAKHLCPDVVVVDIGLPALNGIEVTRQIAKGSQAPSVLILSMHAEDIYVRQALKAGAKGYVLKDVEDLDLVKAVKLLASGGSFLSPGVSQVLLSAYLQDPALAENEDPVSCLSRREREVLRLIAEGKTNKAAAGVLLVSASTIEAHRARVMDKLGLRNTADLVRFAVRNGVLENEV